jgi:hypothetical protein
MAVPIGIVGGVFFWVGGRALHEFGNMERVSAEILGILIAVVMILLSFAAKSLAENLEIADANGSTSLADALRAHPHQSNSVESKENRKIPTKD